eukprot:scaffold171180_cov30-Tisochrysis_lutea.AAC.1
MSSSLLCAIDSPSSSSVRSFLSVVLPSFTYSGSPSAPPSPHPKAVLWPADRGSSGRCALQPPPPPSHPLHPGDAQQYPR